MTDAAVVKRHATCQDVLDAPPHVVAQIVDGALHLRPPPTPRHNMGSPLGFTLGPPDLFGNRRSDGHRRRAMARSRLP